MVLVSYYNTIQNEWSVAQDDLTLEQALDFRKELIKQQLDGDIEEDFMIDAVCGDGIKIVEYTDTIFWKQAEKLK